MHTLRRLATTCLCASLGLPSALQAQATLFQEEARLPPGIEVQLLVGAPLGAAERDLGPRLGYGLAVCYPWHLGGRHLVRPGLEYDRYRIPARSSPPWSSDPGGSRTFHAWRLGVEYVVYQEPWVHRGLYAFLGAGLQYSEAAYPVQDGTRNALVRHHSALTAPWADAGFGYQFTPDIGLELRYAVAGYAAERDQPLGSFTRTESIHRTGETVHLVLTLRAPF